MKLLSYHTIIFNREDKNLKPKIRYYNNLLKFDNINTVIKDELFLIIDKEAIFDLSVLKQLVYEENIAYGDIFVKEINQNVKICLPLVNSIYSSIPKIVKIDKHRNDNHIIEKLNDIFNKNAKEQHLNFLIDTNTIYITNFYFEYIVKLNDNQDEIQSINFNKLYYLCPQFNKKNKKEEIILKTNHLVELFFIDQKILNKINYIFSQEELEIIGNVNEGDIILKYIDIIKEKKELKKVHLDDELISYLMELEKDINPNELYIYIITYISHYFFFENDEFISTLEYEESVYTKIREFFNKNNIYFLDFCK